MSGTVPARVPTAPGALRLRGRSFDAAHPAVMAIVNRTPDSFWAGNRHADLGSALAALDEAVALGADIVDVGGVRAGQEGGEVSAAEELERVVPFLTRAREAHPDLVLSLDTWRAEVARVAAAEAGIDLVNDTWQGADPDLVHVAARGRRRLRRLAHRGAAAADRPGGGHLPAGAARCRRRRPARAPRGGRARRLRRGAADRVLVDPTLDFGKTTAHSLTLLRHTEALVALGFPVLQALSRKDFVGETLDLPADDRLEGTLAATAVAAWLGATVFRAHDVRATRRVVDMVASVRGERPPGAERARRPVVSVPS